jgi:uncharacterized protein (TIGR02118 family)
MRKSDAGAENIALDAWCVAPQSSAELTPRAFSMSIKLVVLYPQPVDEGEFERVYHSQHMPLMRSLIAPATRLRTYRVRMPNGAPFYRMAEVDFDDLAGLEAFARSDGGQAARQSASRASTGGETRILICEEA